MGDPSQDMGRLGGRRLIVTIALVGVLLLSGCTGSEGGGFSDEVRNTFLGECQIASGGNTSYCNCALTYIEDRMSEEEFRRAEVEAALGGDVPAVFVDAVIECGGRSDPEF